jgi:hypothetical protein
LVLVSVLYVMFERVMALVLLCFRSSDVKGEFVGHYNGHRPHRALGLAPPEPRRPKPPVPTPPALAIRRDDRLGGLVHEYNIAA